MLHKLRALDWHATAAIANLPRTYRPILLAITQLGGAVVVSLVISAGIVLAYQVGMYTLAWVYVLTIVATGINFLLKIQFRRRRPDTPYANAMRTKTYSFPSGHAFGVTVAYGLSTMALIPYIQEQWHFAAWLLTIFIIGIVGFSRVYLGAHYVLDVLGGWTFGLVYLSALRFAGLV